MLTVLLIVLMILACLFLALAAFGGEAERRVRWGWLGLFCWAMVVLIGMLAGVNLEVD